MRFVKILYLFLLLVMCLAKNALSLEIDEKLPLRILKTSSSKKTVLINRGIEDGLVVGDHAKFFLTTGIVARGVVIKTSPSRSVWSVYRVVDGSELAQNNVMNLKITPAVKLTNDPTKMLEAIGGSARPQEIVLDPKGRTGTKEKVGGPKIVDDGPLFTDRTWELWGMFHLSSLSTSNSTGAEGTGTSGSTKSFDVTLGVEKYFESLARWYGKISVTPFLHYFSQKSTNVEGHLIDSKVTALGIGGNYHFFAPPLSLNRLILFTGGTLGAGTAQDSASLVPDRTIYQSPTLKGKVTFFSVGVGLKYNFHARFGGRVLLDYYQRGESYPIDASDNVQRDDYTKTVKGPRFLLGLAWKI